MTEMDPDAWAELAATMREQLELRGDTDLADMLGVAA